MVEHQMIDLRALAQRLNARQVISQPEDLYTYDSDAGLDKGLPDGVVFPETTADVVQIVQWASEHRIPLVARGAGTGLSGGAVAEHGGVVVSFARMDQLLGLDEVGRSAVAQPGMITLSLEDVVRSKGLYYPPDPSSGRASTLGGNLAENSGGPHCFKYGVTTNYVTGLEVVLADGRTLQLGGEALDYPGYDLVALLVGSEGTLGLITRAHLRLMRNPPAVKTMMAAFHSVEAAGAAVSAIIARGLVPATLEMMDQKIMHILEEFTRAGLPTHAAAALIIESDGYPTSVTPQIEEFATILREHGAFDLRIAQSAEERMKIWYARKSAAGAIARLAPAFYLVDGTVPRSKLAVTLAGVNQICERYDLRVGYVFHAGDGNLHPLILIEDPKDQILLQRVIDAGRDIVQLCVDAEGSITGEHGVGIEKRAFMPLMYTPAEMDAMKDIKAVFDPHQLLNPEKIFPPDMPPADALPATTLSPTASFVPENAHEAAEAIRAWTQAGQRIRVVGGGTRSGHLPAADVVLSTRALWGIRAYALEDLYVTVGAGTPIAELQAELARDNMWVPLVSPWPESTVGGIISTNWNAPLRIRYGGIRDNLLAATVALPDGRVIRAGRPVVKNVAGYDMPRLFVGAYGTLGLLADVTLKLAPLPRVRASLVVPVDSLNHALEWGTHLRRICLVASALLLVGNWTPTLAGQLPGTADTRYYLIYTAEGLAEDVETELGQAQQTLQKVGVTDVQIIDTPVGSDIWAAFLQSATAAGSTTRVGVPAKDLVAVVRSMASRLGAAPFLADLVTGLAYARDVPDMTVLRREVHAVGGYAVLLNGPRLSSDMSDIWGYTPDGLDLMQAIKARWDQTGQFNPGVFLV